MPLTYTDMYLPCNGVFSVTPFELVGDGRRLFFNCPNGTLRKEIYTVIDGKLNQTPFANGSRLETPIRGFERLVQSPHEAYAIVVDRGAFSLPEISLGNQKSIPVTFDDGQKACITLAGTLRASACISDPCALVKDYLQTGMHSPEDVITTTLEDCLNDNFPQMVSDVLRQVAPHDALGLTDIVAAKLAKEIALQAQQQLDWMRITACRLDLQVVNMTEVVQLSNTTYHERKAMKDKIMTALLNTYGQSPIPGEMVQLMVAYVQTHPNEDFSTLMNLCSGLKSLCELYSPAALMQYGHKFGLIGGP